VQAGGDVGADEPAANRVAAGDKLQLIGSHAEGSRLATASSGLCRGISPGLRVRDSGCEIPGAKGFFVLTTSGCEHATG
ncbi:MAG: hypothetical protein ACK53V_15940, partial [Planctomycetota bacterium]